MTTGKTPKECHHDCQATAGCLGWWVGGVGGVDSCVMYGCGGFKEMYQLNTVSSRVGDCLSK